MVPDTSRLGALSSAKAILPKYIAVCGIRGFRGHFFQVADRGGTLKIDYVIIR